ncbi:MAG: outer membrane lipoprotein chaperone LolA [Vicinamibacterales bacterium]
MLHSSGSPRLNTLNKTMIGVLLLHAMLAGPALAALAPAPSASADEIARAVQQRYDHIYDFTADFTHTYEGGVLKKTSTERGVVEVKKPGRMRWEYTSPEKKLFVSDGLKIYSYIPADKQVIVSPVPADSDTPAALFLSGKGDITRDFTVHFTTGGGSNQWALRLDPKAHQNDYDWLVLIVDKQSLRIDSLVASDQQGGRSTFAFTNYHENTGLPDSAFAFKIPRGVDVITSGSDR